MLSDSSSQEPITIHIQDHTQKELPFPHRAALYLYLPMVHELNYLLLFYIISWANNPLTQPFTFHTLHISEDYNIFILLYRLSDLKLLCGTLPNSPPTQSS